MSDEEKKPLQESNKKLKKGDELPLQKKEEVTTNATELTEQEEVVEVKVITSTDVIDKPSSSMQNELDDANAEDAEDNEATRRHLIEMKHYEAMSLDELVIELEKLLKEEKIQSIRDHVNNIKTVFDKKFNEIIEEKKEEFTEDGGNIIDFHYSLPIKKQFNSIYFDYREKRDDYYTQLKKNLSKNLNARLSIIEELKGMIGSGESMGSTFTHFKELQERWKNAGPVPKANYNDVWKNYHFHVERFYDFLHLDREFRDMDFKHNLDQKLKIIERAEELAEENDLNRSFRELQLLHKMWKEELGPVAREHRDEIWDRFSHATKIIHDKRQDLFKELDDAREKNYEVKKEIVAEISKISNSEIKNHNDAQERMKNIDKLRELFFSAGEVPKRVNEDIWDEFKKSVRAFNRKKNAYYKNLKKTQYDNLNQKLKLIEIAEANKDSDDFEAVVAVMKKIQDEWKSIGHVPRKDSDRIWKKFKKACNHFFKRFHDHKDGEHGEENDAFNKKKDLITAIKQSEVSTSKEDTIAFVKKIIEEWGAIGHVQQNKRYVESKFNKALDYVLSKAGIDKKEVEMLKYENRLQALEDASGDQQIAREQNFLRKKIDETKDNLNQFENNLQFFSNTNSSNPLVVEVKTKIEKLKSELEMWKTKLKKVKTL